MALNLKALKDVQEDLNNRGSSNLYFYASEIDGETDVRLLPPLPHMNGIYFVEQVGYWINKKFYVSPETFDMDCPITEEIEDAKAQNDPDINELLNSQDLAKKSRFLIPILKLACKFDKDGECTHVDVEDKKGKILVAGPMLMKAINKNVVSRNYQNGTEDGIMDRVKGFNIILDKTGKKLNTEYTALGWMYPWEMEEDYYKEANIPDIIKITEADIHSDDFLRAVIRNYIYGEPMPKEDNKNGGNSDDDDDKPAPRRGNAKSEDETPKRRGNAPVKTSDKATPRRSAPEPEEEEEEEVAPKRRGNAPTAAKAKVKEPEPEEEEEEYEEEEPPMPKKKAVKKEEPAAARPRRNIIGDLDNI